MPKSAEERQREFLRAIGQEPTLVTLPGCNLIATESFFDIYLKREEDDGKETKVRPRKVRRLLRPSLQR